MSKSHDLNWPLGNEMFDSLLHWFEFISAHFAWADGMWMGINPFMKQIIRENYLTFISPMSMAFLTTVTTRIEIKILVVDFQTFKPKVFAETVVNDFRKLHEFKILKYLIDLKPHLCNHQYWQYATISNSFDVLIFINLMQCKSTNVKVRH